jgi:anti-sigma regulatory factor (Ser/Thr protein kinase)
LFDNSDDLTLSKYADRILIAALAELCGWAPLEVTKFVQLVISEGMRNSMIHAAGSFALVSMRVDPKNLTVAIGDNGVGIPETLRVAYKRTKDRKDVVERSESELIKLFTQPEIVMESHLIKAAFKKGTTSAEGRKGVGLFYLKNTVLEYDGTLRIRSGRACVDFSSRGDECRDDMLSSPGTTLRITAPRRT